VATATVFTVGYQDRTLEELVGLLAANGVAAVVDVRLHAVSRRRGFSKAALSSALSTAGMTYVHERSLGNPRENRPGYLSGQEEAKRVYAQHLDEHGGPALDRLRSLVGSGPVALLCYERDGATCHRTAVAERLGTSTINL
jgi:uncharacterized protein (DUF488 family)